MLLSQVKDRHVFSFAPIDCTTMSYFCIQSGDPGQNFHESFGILDRFPQDYLKSKIMTFLEKNIYFSRYSTILRLFL